MDHCRIGSLEIAVLSNDDDWMDHCRIGSLEMVASLVASQVC